jgi:hypothetical protein
LQLIFYARSNAMNSDRDQPSYAIGASLKLSARLT